MSSEVFFMVVLLAIATVVSSTPVKNGQPELSCPAGEILENCSQIHCYKKCTHLKRQPACPIVSADCYNPACECNYGNLRNADGVCIPENQCPEWEPEH